MMVFEFGEECHSRVFNFATFYTDSEKREIKEPQN